PAVPPSRLAALASSGCGGWTLRGEAGEGRPTHRRRVIRGFLLVLAVTVLAAGCGAGTGVDVTVRSNGSGTVAVTVTLDRAALTQVGDLAAQLQTSDLTQAGWTVARPRPGPDGSEVVSATRPFATPSEAGPDLASLAGSGPASTRPFRIALSRRRTFWHTSVTVSGTVDLTCGVGCFGDAGLAKQTGSVVGVDPGSLSAQSGQTAAQALTFSVVVELPGQVRAATPGVVNGHVVTWKPVLGQTLAVAASSQSVNRGSVTAGIVGAAVVLILVAAAVVTLVRRHRHRQDHRRRHRRGGPRPGSQSAAPDSVR
ncbi:MAG: hypothetical protein M3Y36_12100, partial [Actinomycetota bacterium]|nr:hypothetical protein [Actinomycetota bacterium]